MLERIYESKRKETTGREKRNNDFHEVHFSQNNFKDNKMGRTCIMHRKDEKSLRYFIRKTEIKNSLERFRTRWEDNLKLYLK